MRTMAWGSFGGEMDAMAAEKTSRLCATVHIKVNGQGGLGCGYRGGAVASLLDTIMGGSGMNIMDKGVRSCSIKTFTCIS